MSGFQLASSNPLAPCGFDAAFLPPGAVARTPGLPEDSRSRSVCASSQPWPRSVFSVYFHVFPTTL